MFQPTREVREGYLTWAAVNHNRMKVVKAAASPDEVFERIRLLLDAHGNTAS